MRLPTRLLRRKPDANKGDFGHIFILAGSRRYSGAALLCAEGAMRAGAGLVTLGFPEKLTSSLIKTKPREAMLLPLPQTKEGTLALSGFAKINDFLKNADVLAIGPGLTRDKSTKALIRKVIRAAKKPLVIDADALNALAGHLKILQARRQTTKPATIITPHPGEMSRLLGITIKKVQQDREKLALNFAKKYRSVVVLKGHNTVVADCSNKLYINKTGNPGMATAGSGDVLTGMIAAFLGQGLNHYEAAKYGVYLHGLAGDLAAGEKTQISLIASDIIAKIPEAIKRSGS